MRKIIDLSKLITESYDKVFSNFIYPINLNVLINNSCTLYAYTYIICTPTVIVHNVTMEILYTYHFWWVDPALLNWKETK